MALEVVLVAGLAVGLAVALVKLAPGLASGIVMARLVVAGILAVIGGLFLISTGIRSAMIVGALILFLIVLDVLVTNDGAEVW